MTHTTRDIDYAAVSPPVDTEPAEYHYTHRRAALLEDILEHGTPAAITQRNAAERYGVDLEADVHSRATTEGYTIVEVADEQATLDTVADDIAVLDDENIGFRASPAHLRCRG